VTASELRCGVFLSNPVFRLALGLFPALAVTSTMSMALVMSILVTCVLAASTYTISLARNFIPQRVRIPCQLIIVAAYASVADLVLCSRFPGQSDALGMYVPLIAVNCLILHKVETFAAKNKPMASLVDSVVTGIGFAVALLGCAAVREILGTYSFMGRAIIPSRQPILAMTSACGAFFSLALVLSIFNYFARRKKKDTQS
jgi:electron transport complex protein RnfE